MSLLLSAPPVLPILRPVSSLHCLPSFYSDHETTPFQQDFNHASSLHKNHGRSSSTTNLTTASKRQSSIKQTAPNDPKQWEAKRKWQIVIAMTSITLTQCLFLTIIAPASASVAKDLHMNEIESQMAVTIFELATALGPFLFGPLSEMYGRNATLQILNLACLAFQFGCGWVRSKTQLLILRFLAGFGGASAISIGAAIIGDLFEPEDRSAPQALYSMAFACGPALGPIAGGFIAEYSTWRWCFWASSALGLLVVILGLFLLHETYLPILQARNKPKRHSRQLGQTPTKRFQWQPLARPFQMLCIEPTVMLLALYVGFITGIFYLVITVLAAVYTSPEFYHQSLSMSGLHYIALTIGFLAGSTFNAPAAKKVYLYLAKTRYPNAPPRPEYRVPNLLIGSLLVPAGMFLFAWSAQYHLHWSIPDLGIVIFCTGYIINMQCMMLYLIDTYTLYAASAIAATTVLRSLMGFGLPLAAPKMLQALGLGWTISLLGFVAVGLGIPAPFVFWRYGERLRRRSRFARSS